jgi:formylglycine-generating enzyme required for sulfatase activity/tRNA A-37 threonylcarbamoyl transferase component Bud32
MQALECPSDEQLAAFALGDLRERDYDAVSRHVESCAECESRLDTLEHVCDGVIGALRHSVNSQGDVRSASGSTATRLSAGPGRTAQLPAGTILGDYIIECPLGEGGMGQVYKALHQRMNRTVAVKIVAPRAIRSPEALARFRREIEVVARLAHPNVATAYDAREHEGTHYLVLEYVSGRDLAKLVKRDGPLDPRRAAGYILQAARGLAHAHRLGIVHRDVKPANLMLDDTGTIKVLDLGLARLGAEDGATIGPDISDTTVVASDLTVAGSVMGTYNYMAPEQAADPRAADARADIYSLGCTLWYLLAGKAPFDHPRDGIRTVVDDSSAARRPDIPAGVAVPASLKQTLDRMLASNPRQRFASMDEVVSELERFVARSIWPRRRLLTAAAAISLMAIAYGGYRFAHDPPGDSRPTLQVPPPPLPVAPFSADQAQRHRAAWAKYAGVAEKTSSPTGIKLALIPPGEFHLHGRYPVRITRPYYLAEHEVTVVQFRQFVEETNYRTQAERSGGMIHADPRKPQISHSKESNWRNPGFPVEQTDDHPVVQLCWLDADHFCRWLSATEGHTYRLPTQTEWEWAARAGTITPFHFGSDAQKFNEYDWCAENSGRMPQPVGKLRPNLWGLYDLQGNAVEFCRELDGANLDAAVMAIDPQGGRTGTLRICRGGAFYNSGPDREITKIGAVGETFSMWGFGFRVLREVPASTGVSNASYNSPL